MSIEIAPRWEPIAGILEQAEARFAYAFGSRVTAGGRPRPDSDLDLAFDTEARLSLLERSRIARKIAEALHVPDVDLIILAEAPLELKAKVIREGELVYSADEPARVAFQVRTLSEFLDFEPTLRRLERARLKHIAAHGLGS